MKYKLMVEQFGKIKKAEIEFAPFMLLVGDNNSGKSYLLSLIWGILSAGNESVIWKDMENLQLGSYLEVRNKLCRLLEELEKDEDENAKGEIQISSEKCMEILNALLEQNKGRFVAGIFNSEQVSIQKLEISGEEKVELTIKEKKRGQQRHFWVDHGIGSLIFLGETKKTARRADTLLKHILLSLLKDGKDPYNSRKNVVYLPAARTGFILSKNVINRVGRQMAYDRMEFYGVEQEEEIQPFTKPVISFLDTLEELSLDHQTEYERIVSWMEHDMAHGKVQYDSETNGTEIRYIPEGSGVSLPLRTTSAVVTELTPLLLLLKYSRRLRAICYEEPEMCLHPKLQQEMGKLLIRLVNSGISMITATHSDIIIQHINNMCRLKELGAPKQLMEKLELSELDVMDINKIAVYQFIDQGEYSQVQKVVPEGGEFQVETFSNALMQILEQTSEVQDFEPGQEG